MPAARAPRISARKERQIRHWHLVATAELERLGAGAEEHQLLAQLAAGLRQRALILASATPTFQEPPRGGMRSPFDFGAHMPWQTRNARLT